jgi:O-antigen/teichoic acid export membrane protein
MNVPRRVAWNTIAQTAARILTLALSVLTTSLLTRHLGVSGYGVYVTVTVYLPFFALFFDVGLTTYVVRSLSADRTPSGLFREALGLRIVLTVPVTLLAFVLAALIYGSGNGTTTRNAIAIGLPIILFATAASATSALFQARLEMDRVALSEIVGQLVATSLIVLFVINDLSIYPVVAAAVAGALVNMVLLLFLASRIESVRPLLRPAHWARLLRAALPLGLAVMVATVYFRADALLLSVLKGSDAVGIYGVAYRLLEAVIAFPGFLYVSIFPLLALAAARGALDNLRGITQRAFDVLVLAAVPLVCGTVTLAPEIVHALAGDRFDAAVTPLRIVIFGAGLTFVNGLFSFVLIAADRQTTLLWTGLLTLAFNVALNLSLIPRYSYTAAAAVATGSEALTLAALLVLVMRSIGFTPDLRIAGKAAVAGAVMIACVAFTRLNLALLVALGACAYSAVLLLLRTHASLQLRELLGAKRLKPSQ